MTDLALMAFQRREHEAWLAAGAEFKALGIDIEKGGNGERVHAALVRWGEELAQLRIADPDSSHAARALEERRELFREVCT